MPARLRDRKYLLLHPHTDLGLNKHIHSFLWKKEPSKSLLHPEKPWNLMNQRKQENPQCLLVMAHQTQPLVPFWPTRKTSISLLPHGDREGGLMCVLDGWFFQGLTKVLASVTSNTVRSPKAWGKLLVQKPPVILLTDTRGSKRLDAWVRGMGPFLANNLQMSSEGYPLWSQEL